MKISVVIPVYNKADYIRQCLTDVLGQHFDDFEVVAVDDGSTDASGEICDEVASRDSRCKVVHTENCGVTAARRRGVAEARGRYVVFVDADDRLLPGALRSLYDAIEANGADEVIGRYCTCRGESPLLPSGPVGDLTPLVTALVAHRGSFPILWGIIYRREILDGCLSTPREIVEGEDLLMQLGILMKNPRLCFVSQCVYFYNEGVPNSRKRTLEREMLYDRLLRQILEPEWETYRAVYVMHQIKQYEEFLMARNYGVRRAYYSRAIPSPLPGGVPLLRRLVWSLHPVLGRLLVLVYRKSLKMKSIVKATI